MLFLLRKFIFGGQFFLVLALLGCGGSSSEGKNEGLPVSQISLTPLLETVSVGDIFSRTVEVQNVGDTYYAAFDLTYDPTVIKFSGITEGSFLNPTGSDSTSLQSALENGLGGRLTIGITRLGSIGDVSGSGDLLTFSFEAVGVGTTTLAFTTPSAFLNNSNETVAIDIWENSDVTVQ